MADTPWNVFPPVPSGVANFELPSAKASSGPNAYQQVFPQY